MGRWAWLGRIATLATGVAIAAAAQAQQPAATQWKLLETFRDCPTCPVLVPLAAATYRMGIPDGEDERERVPTPFRFLSKPRHEVRIPASFAIGKYEVTRAEYAEFVAATKRQVPSRCLILGSYGNELEPAFDDRDGYSFRDPGFQQTDQDPVVCVSWRDAKDYAAWLSTKTGKRYRLPSEAEWEYAARANEPSARYWGESVQQICDYANAGDLSLMRTPGLRFRATSPEFACEDKFAYSAPVGRFKSNAFGLHDMLGNAGEWVEDCWTDDYGKAPEDGGPQTQGDCKRRVVRGGSWFNVQARLLRVGARVSHEVDTRISITGFRVVRER